MSILVSLVAGWALLIGITFAIQSYDGALESATGVPPAQIFIDATGARPGCSCCSSRSARSCSAGWPR